jgi:N-acetylglucosaminyl-diphospho-decaprenol L-rhamnosyltransferase
VSASPPSVGVVVLTRDRRAGALSTLDRLVELPERPEIVLVDDASADGTARAVSRRHPGVRVVSLPRNAGASGRNAGVRALDSDLAALSDDDSWWAPGALSRARDVFAARPSLGLLQARILVGPHRHLDPVCTAMAASPLAARPGLPGPAILGFVACGAVVRRTAFLGSGGFNPHFGIGGEERLLALDMAANGWELAYVDSVVAHHHPDSGAPRPGRHARTLRNDLWTTWLRGRFPGAAVDTIRIAAGAGRDARGPGLLAALRGLPWVLAARRPLAPALDRAARRV